MTYWTYAAQDGHATIYPHDTRADATTHLHLLRHSRAGRIGQTVKEATEEDVRSALAGMHVSRRRL